MSINQRLPEITIRVVVLSILLTVVLALSNAYLALKIGILTSASIPAAIISMGILRFWRNATIFENNLVQTAASAGEAVAGGIVYTVPALVILHYWQQFDYWTNCAIALIGGILGVLFSIPLRRMLVNDPELKFPEGQAIASVLEMSNSQHIKLKPLLYSGIVGATLELAQAGLKIIANSWQAWWVSGRTLFGFGAGFSPTMIGAGYLIGINSCVSIFIGAVIGWLFSVPIVSEFYPSTLSVPAAQQVMALWSSKLSYMGIGAMLLAGMWTLASLCKPLYRNICHAYHAKFTQYTKQLNRTEQDIPLHYVIIGIALMTGATYVLFQQILPISLLPQLKHYPVISIISCLIYVLLVGFICSGITAYFSGMVGVTASPGSAIIIASLLLAACILYQLLPQPSTLSPEIIRAAEAVTIIMGAIITGAAAIANDNMQDLKVGHLIGATPWKQQVMLILGVIISALVIPPIMQLLFSIYGIADVLPHANMDPTQTLPAPPAALMAAITRGVFRHDLPWNMLIAGMIIIAAMIAINYLLQQRYQTKMSILGIAIGIYLPLASSTPLFIGGMIAWWLHHASNDSSTTQFAENKPSIKTLHQQQRGMLAACGLIAGSVLMDVILAAPFALLGGPDALRITGPHWYGMAGLLGIVSVCCLAWWFKRVSVSS
ncbi:MAG: oligopeptide transporter, OPT family [Gammaproteobacteria bacterium]